MDFSDELSKTTQAAGPEVSKKKKVPKMGMKTEQTCFMEYENGRKQFL